jgi:hypothetical protein
MITRATVSWVTYGLKFRGGGGHGSFAASAPGDTGANHMPKI